jgi:hypothetical protein
MRPIHYLLGAAILAIVIMIFLWPPSGPSKDQIEREAQYKRQHAIDSTEKAQIIAYSDTIVMRLKQYQKEDSARIASLTNDNKRLRSNVHKSRPNVQPYLDSLPVLKSFVAQQDSLIENQDSTISYLQAANYRTMKEFDALSIAIVDERKIAEKMIQDCDSNREAVQKDVDRDVKKERRKKVLAQVLIPIVAVGAFLLSK